MSTIGVSKALTAIAVVVLTALPAVAQEARRREGRQGGQEGQARSGGERRRPRGDDVQQGRREQPGAAADRGSRRSEANQAVPRREAVPRSETGRRNDTRDRDDARRIEPQRGRDRARVYGGRDDRWRDERWRDNGPRYLPAPRAYRGTYYRPRVYTVPYGWRPRGYRPGWSFNLYFGRPFGNYYAYPGYYGQGAYGYFGIPSGFAYGSVRIVDAPRRAPVFVDGYYAGEVDDYDGVFQRLNLEPGRHTIELDVYPGAPPLAFDVYVEPGRTVTIHARP